MPLLALSRYPKGRRVLVALDAADMLTTAEVAAAFGKKHTETMRQALIARLSADPALELVPGSGSAPMAYRWRIKDEWRKVMER